MVRSISFVLLAPLMLAACGDQQAPRAADAEAAASAPAAQPAGPALRLSVNPEAPSAAYVTLRGEGTARTLIGVTSPDAERVELHESRQENGMMTMASVERIDVPADGEVAMRPGGLHLMVYGVSEAARTAGSLRLTLRYADGSSADVVATSANLPALEATVPHGGGEDHSGH